MSWPKPHCRIPVALVIAGGLSLPTLAWGHGDDDPLLAKVMVDQFEWRRSTGGDQRTRV